MSSLQLAIVEPWYRLIITSNTTARNRENKVFIYMNLIHIIMIVSMRPGRPEPGPQVSAIKSSCKPLVNLEPYGQDGDKYR